LQNYDCLTIFLDSQVAIKRTLNDNLGPRQALAVEIITIAKWLKEKDIQVSIRWVPSHSGIEGNEKADLLAKKTSKQPKSAQIDDYSFFNYIQNLVKRQKALETQEWLFNTQKQWLKHQDEFQEMPNSSLTANKVIFQARKRLSSRFFQLKIGHAITATYLKRIQKIDNTHY
jgi:RNase H